MIKNTFIIFIIVCTLLAVFGFVYTPNLRRTFINPNISNTNPVCSEVPTRCQTDKDCSKCVDSNVFEIKCSENNDKNKYCLPVKPEKPCNEKFGGVWEWTGWASSHNKEWECKCVWPEIAGNRGCTQINPNICTGGVYNFLSTHPTPANCVCPKGTLKIVQNDNLPLCIPQKGFCINEKECSRFYGNIDALGK